MGNTFRRDLALFGGLGRPSTVFSIYQPTPMKNQLCYGLLYLHVIIYM